MEENKTRFGYWLLYEFMHTILDEDISRYELRKITKELNLGDDFAITPRKLNEYISKFPEEKRKEADKYLTDVQDLKTIAVNIKKEYMENLENGVQMIASIDPKFINLFNTLPYNSISAYVGDTPLERSPFISENIAPFTPKKEGIPSKPKSGRIVRIHLDKIQPKNDTELYSNQDLQKAYENNVLIISPYHTLASDVVKETNKTLREVLNTRYANNEKDVIQKANEKLTKMREQNQSNGKRSFQQKDRFESMEQAKNISKVVEAKQIRNYIGPYISKKDMDMIERKMKGAKFDTTSLARSEQLLRYMYDNNIEFKVNVPSVVNEKNGQLEVTLKDSNMSKVRVLDSQRLDMIGRVSSSAGHYFYPGNRKTDNWTPEKPYAIVDFVMGNRDAHIEHNKTKSTYIRLDGIRKKLLFTPETKRMNALSVGSVREAEGVIREFISQASILYRDELLGDSAKDFDEILFEQQKEFLKEIEEIDKLDATDRVKNTKKNKLVDSTIEEVIGSYETGFDVAKVLSYAKNLTQFDRTEKLVAALKMIDYDMDKIRGTDFGTNIMKDRLVKFNESTAVSIEEQTDPFLKSAMQRVQTDLSKLRIFSGENFAKKELPIVKIDEQGIIRWEGTRMRGGHNGQPEFIQGEIGQIFSPDKNGVLETKFGSGENYGFVPGYKGYFSYEGTKENVPRMDRLRVVGYEQSVNQKLSEIVRSQVIRPTTTNSSKEIGLSTDSTRLNTLYHGEVYGKRIELGWYENTNLREEIKDAILQTYKGTVRFPNKYSDLATTHGIRRSKKFDENTKSEEKTILDITGNKNMRILEEDYINVFDMTMTGSDKTQGLTLRLTEGAEVLPNGAVKPSETVIDKDGQVVPDAAPIMKLEEFDNAQYNAWNRNQMSANQLMVSEKIAYNSRTALMNLGGWTFDDSYAVSKAFADKNLVTKKDGTQRPLQIGDKISDFGGNKGTIGIIIDADMSIEDAKEQSLEREVAIFKANPTLEVVGSPYSMLSRHNGGVIRELMDTEDIQQIIDPHTNEVIGESGELNILVTNMLVDEKTKVYDKKALTEGKGRKFSAQLGWAATEHEAEGILREVFQNNTKAWANYKEYLNVCGYDMNEGGHLSIGVHQDNQQEYANKKRIAVDPSLTQSEFIKTIGSESAILVLPNKIKLSSGVETNELPILKSSLRRSSELMNGEMKVHNYTSDYAKVYQQALELQTFNKLKEKILDDLKLKEGDIAKEGEPRENFKKAFLAQKDDHLNAQKNLLDRQVASLESKIRDDQLGGLNGEYSKTGYLRNHIMGKRLQNSANAVATADPRLPIDSIKVSPEILKNLGVKEGEYVAIWRDPILRSGGLRGMKVYVDENITGMAMNPIVDKSFDGDFDGDMYGIAAFKSEEAKRELETNLSMAHNLIDPSSPTKSTSLNVSMDLLSSSVDAEVTKENSPHSLKQQLVKKVSDFANKYTPQTAVNKTNELIQKCLREHDYGSATVMLHSEAAMLDSFKDMVVEGSKGNEHSLKEYTEYYKGEKGLKDAQQIQAATGYKSDDTGVAGSYSQKLIALMRNVNSEAALEMTQPITQGTFQIKHDAQKGAQIDKILNEDLRNLLNGFPRTNAFKEDYGTVPTDTFKYDLQDIFEELNVDVREDHIQAVADCLSEDGVIVGLNSKMNEAAPLDQIAYPNQNGGLRAIHRLAESNASLVEGKWTSAIAPEVIREKFESGLQTNSHTLTARLSEVETKENVQDLMHTLTVAEVEQEENEEDKELER